MHYHSAIIFLFIFLVNGSVNSAESIDPKIYQVQSGGVCFKQEKQGHIRVVIKNKGFEHITSTVQAECISNSAPETSPKILFQYILEDSGYFSLQIDRLEFINGVTEISLNGVASHSGWETNCLYRITKEGNLQIITSCAEGTNHDST